MLLKWARWLPYWLVMRLMKNQSSADGQGVLKLSKDYLVSYYQVSEGEFVVYSQDIQDAFNERKESKRIKKMNEKLDKINKTLDSDITLKKQLEKQFDDEKLYDDY